MSKQLISEQTVIEAARRGSKTVHVAGGSIITAAAKDRAASLGITFAVKSASTATNAEPLLTPRAKDTETLVIGADHGGFQMKQALIPYLKNLGHKIVDVGTYTEEPCDYPDFAYMVARMVSLGEAHRGIMIDSVGAASSIVANKVPGVRAACCPDEFSAKSSREHNDANVLTLGGKVLGLEAAKAIVKTWLETWFGGGRHKGRVDKITEIERRFSR